MTIRRILWVLALALSFMGGVSGGFAQQLDLDRLLKARDGKPSPSERQERNVESEATASHRENRTWRESESAAKEAQRQSRFSESGFGRTKDAICGGSWDALYTYCTNQCAGLRNDNGGLLFGSSDKDRCVSTCTGAKHTLCSSSTCTGFLLICDAPCGIVSGTQARSCRKACEQVQSDCLAQGGR